MKGRAQRFWPALLVLATAGCGEEPVTIAPVTANVWNRSGVLRGLAVDGALDVLGGELLVENAGRHYEQSLHTTTATSALPAAWQGFGPSDPTSTLRRGSLGPFFVWQEVSPFGGGLAGTRLLYTLRARERLEPAPFTYYRLVVPLGDRAPAFALDEVEYHAEVSTSTVVRVLAHRTHVRRIAFQTERATWEVIPSRPTKVVEVTAERGKLELLLTLSTRTFEPGASVSIALRLRRAEKLASSQETTADELLEKTWARTASVATESHDRFAAALQHGDAPAAVLASKKQELRALLGLEPLPERTPLDAHVVGTIEREGYFVDKLWFESRPGFVVTANLYRPAIILKGTRRPAVVTTSGHYVEGKAQPDTQRLAASLARFGFVVLALDTIGTGERAGAEWSHDWAFPATLLGTTFAAYGVWDVMRAIDYLETRPDVAPARIGLTGFSGGGMLTLLTAAVDDRVHATAPAGWPDALRDLFAAEQSYCACNYLPGLARHADIGDIVALLAPKPVLLLAGEQDLDVPIHGVWRTRADASTAYQHLGANEALQIATAPGSHGYSQPLREAMYGFMSKQLANRGTGAPRFEPDVEVLSPAELAVGPVAASKESYRSLLRKEARRLDAHLPALSPSARREALREVTSWASATRLVGELALAPRATHSRAISLVEADGVELRALRAEAHRPGERPIAVVIGSQRAEQLLEQPVARTLRARQLDVVAVELRGTGASAPPENARIFLAGASLTAGAPILALRAREITAFLRFLAPHAGPGGIFVVSTGMEDSLAATLALALEPIPEVRGAVLGGLPASLVDVFAPSESLELHQLAIPGLLRWADLPELLDLVDVPVRTELDEATEVLARLGR